jgi:maltose O-acetyltransferase
MTLAQKIRADVRWSVQMLRSDLRALPRELLTNSIAASPLVPRVVRFLLYRLAGLDVRTPNVYAGCTIAGRDLRIGRRCGINRECFFDATGPVRIGRSVHFGMRVNVVTSTHEPGDDQDRAGRVITKPVTVDDGCWIGAGVTLLPGAHVGRATVVAAGAVVSGICESNALYAGVPARKLRDL